MRIFPKWRLLASFWGSSLHFSLFERVEKSGTHLKGIHEGMARLFWSWFAPLCGQVEGR